MLDSDSSLINEMDPKPLVLTPSQLKVAMLWIRKYFLRIRSAILNNGSGRPINYGFGRSQILYGHFLWPLQKFLVF
jgi:hypothetical protein